jgi:tetratricopeptide (TPR) repeat protein
MLAPHCAAAMKQDRDGPGIGAAGGFATRAGRAPRMANDIRERTMRSRLRFLAIVGVAAGLSILAPSHRGFAFGSSTEESAGDTGFTTAEKLIKEQNYADAIPLLENIVQQQPDDADALNYLGFSHRKLGHQEIALDYYLKALAAKPDHPGANEYLGELYLEMNRLPDAEQRLAALKQACGDCEEYRELEEKIADFKAQ